MLNRLDRRSPAGLAVPTLLLSGGGLIVLGLWRPVWALAAGSVALGIALALALSARWRLAGNPDPVAAGVEFTEAEDRSSHALMIGFLLVGAAILVAGIYDTVRTTPDPPRAEPARALPAVAQAEPPTQPPTQPPERRREAPASKSAIERVDFEGDEIVGDVPATEPEEVPEEAPAEEPIDSLGQNTAGDGPLGDEGQGPERDAGKGPEQGIGDRPEVPPRTEWSRVADEPKVAVHVVPKVAIRDLQVSGSLEEAVVLKALMQRRSQVEACYAREVKRRPDLEGLITGRFTVTGEGKVADPALKSSADGLRQVERCIVQMVKRLRFPYAAGGTQVELSYAFKTAPR